MTLVARRGEPRVLVTLAALAAVLALGACAGDDASWSKAGTAAARGGGGFDDKARVQLRLARAAQDSGNMRAAIRFYRAVLDQTPGHIGAIVGLGEALDEAGSPDEAVGELSKAVMAASDNPEARIVLGRAMIHAHRPNEALTQFEAVLERNPGDLRARVNHGVALDLLGRHDEAQDSYRQVLRAQPANAAAGANLGLSLSLSGRGGEAVAILEDLVRAGAESTRIRQNLALAYGLKGDTDAAARTARLDLDEENVRSNLAFYEAVRPLVADASRGAGAR